MVYLSILIKYYWTSGLVPLFHHALNRNPGWTIKEPGLVQCGSINFPNLGFLFKIIFSIFRYKASSDPNMRCIQSETLDVFSCIAFITLPGNWISSRFFYFYLANNCSAPGKKPYQKPQILDKLTTQNPDEFTLGLKCGRQTIMGWKCNGQLWG